MGEREVLFAIYEQALVSAQDPTNDEWVDPSFECLTRGQSAVIMTAYNPGTERPTWAQNEEANVRMLQVLLGTYPDVWRADGFSPDGTWREPGWLVWGMPMNHGCAVAAEFGQFAVYYYDEEGVRTVVSCDDSTPPASI